MYRRAGYSALMSVSLLVVAMAASPSLLISSQAVAYGQRKIEDYEEVSVESAVVWSEYSHVLTSGIWCLCVEDKGT